MTMIAGIVERTRLGTRCGIDGKTGGKINGKPPHTGGGERREWIVPSAVSRKRKGWIALSAGGRKRRQWIGPAEDDGFAFHKHLEYVMPLFPSGVRSK